MRSIAEENWLNRAIGLFIGFCLLLAVAVAGVVWWMGPPLAQLAFDGERGQRPFFTLFLQPGKDTAADFQGQFLQQLVPAQGTASLSWQASQPVVVSGSMADEWDAVLAINFATGRDFVRLVTSQDYRAIRGQMPGEGQLLVGTSDAPLKALAHPAALLLLVSSQDAAALETWLTTVGDVGGELLWDAGAVVIEQTDQEAASWNRLLLVGSADKVALQTWAFSLDAQTASALLKAKSTRLNLWLVQPQLVDA